MPLGMRTVLVILAVLAMATVQAGDWPGWRGPTGMGRVDDEHLPVNWGGKDSLNVLWKVALPGQKSDAAQDQNQSSPIVSRGRVIVTTSYWPGGKADPKHCPEHHVACYLASDGKLLWDRTVEPGPWLFSDLRGGYTAPTPAADGERIYVIFGSAVMAAFDYEGKQLWRQEIKPYRFDVALAASPVLFDGNIILQCDQTDSGSRLVGYDCNTGAIKWTMGRPSVSFGHSTPVLATIDGKKELLVSASNALQGVDPTNGKVLWTCAAKGDTVTPVMGKGLVYCDSGRGGPGLAVDPSGEGDITKTHRKWTIPNVKEGYSSPVVSGDYLYRLQNPEVIGCYKMATGEPLFSERLPGVSASSSPLVVPGGRIYLASAGRSYVLKSGPTLDILATNDLGDSGPASPAVADGKLFLKGRKWLFCVGNKS